MSEAGTALILGATSAMARAVAAELAGRGWDLVLAARDHEELEFIAADLRVRHQVTVHELFLDALAFETHEAFYQQAKEAAGGRIDGVVMALGYLGTQPEAQVDMEVARRIVDTNYTAAVTLLGLAANDLEAQGAGWVCGISSVAGDRGRQSNYVYGSAKAALTTFLQGLRIRLYKAGVGVTIVKPGFVDTKMTFGLPGLFLVASPASVARRIVAAIEAGKPEVYTPFFWYWIMLIIRWIPDFVFKRMKM